MVLQRNLFYRLGHLLPFGRSAAEGYQKFFEILEIIGARSIGEIRLRFKASMVVWGGDPFSLASYARVVVACGQTQARLYNISAV